MSAQSLESLLQTVGNPVTLVRNSQIGPYVYPKVPSEFSNWRDEQHAWRETCCLFDQSHHMTDCTSRALMRSSCSRTSASTASPRSRSTRPSSSSPATPDGYVIGDAILFYLDEELFNLVGRPSAHNWVQYHGETGDYDVDVERDERSAVNPTGRKLYRFQVQGPTALEVLEKVTGGPLPEIKFFNMGRLTIAGHQVRALHHGMSGVPGLELFGPAERRRGVRAAIVEAGQEFGLRRSARGSTRPTRSSRAGFRVRCRPSSPATSMKAYREWLPADRLRGNRLARRQLLLGRHRGLLPDAVRARLRAVRQVRPRFRRPGGAREDGRQPDRGRR